jgi:hypothetical protein
MPLNKLENFIKNTEGRILYVNPSDLDATDSIVNQGNSLTKPFRTIQRALIESARFSYLKGNDNDIVEKTTILLFPGEHVVDNRPGYGIKTENIGGIPTAKSVTPAGSTQKTAIEEFSLSTLSNFDLNQNNNILYKFNSINGGAIVPRGVSLVGLDLRKTKIRPTYIPNPTDPDVKNSAIFRITGGCYFWQFSILDGDENGTVYTDPIDSSILSKAKPTFSHHKLTVFEYADGANIAEGYDISDLDMYYNKLSNAYNSESNRPITPKYPEKEDNFSKLRPEWEIVGAFATDPINIESIISGNGSVASDIITVTTTVPHNLSVGTPIKIRGVRTTVGGVADQYNVSTKVASIDPLDSRKFTYLLTGRPNNLNPSPASANATVTIETDTVSGASPYVFNVSLRSIWGMNGMHADGSKASGFRSMVVAQFTAISLQKDDRAFVKYNPVTRTYESVNVTKQFTGELSSQSSQTDSSKVYHLDPDAIYRKGWQSSHIKISNDAFVQIVSVFAIGFNKHFDARSGGDGSITNSNSNFGQYSLCADGFKKEAFEKDDKAFITSIVAPRAIVNPEIDIDWVPIDVGITSTVGISSHLYLFGFKNPDDPPPIVTQGYRIGARKNDKLYIPAPNDETKESSIQMLNNLIGVGSSVGIGTFSSEKSYKIIDEVRTNNIFSTTSAHSLINGEKIRLISDTGDLPENITEHIVYYAITTGLLPNQFKIASSLTNAITSPPSEITVYSGTQLKVVSRVSDKLAGERAHPIQYDTLNSNWYIHVNANNTIYPYIKTVDPVQFPRTDVSFFKRIEDGRSLDEKLYKLRVVVPRAYVNARDPEKGFVIQESSTTNVRNNLDFTSVPVTGIGGSDYDYNRNVKFISSCTFNSSTNLVTIQSDLPHNLNVGNRINIKGITSVDNPSAIQNRVYNGSFIVNSIINDKTFTYSSTDVSGIVHTISSLSTCTNNFNSRTISLPTFENNDNKGNLFIYRSEVIKPYIQNVQDGIYYLYPINSSIKVTTEFTDLEYTQNIVDLYPQLDRDNIDDNPPSSKTFAKRSPLGDTVTNDLKNSITRETIDKFYRSFDISPEIVGVTSTSTTATLTLSREHGFAGITTIAQSDVVAGTGYTNGTYYNVKLFNNGTSNWDGATARVTVSNNQVSQVIIISGGSGYTANEVLQFDSSVIGPGGSGASVTVRSTGISTITNHVIQVTGIGTAPDGYYRSIGIGNTRQVSIAKTIGDPQPTVGQYIINNGPVSIIQSFTSTSGIATFTCTGAHGLLVGNRLRLTDASNNNLGDYIVRERIGTNIFSVSGYSVNPNLTPYYVLKHGLSANSATADASVENVGVRDVFFYDNDYLILDQDVIDDTEIKVSVGIATASRFPLGSYIQIDNEIMRITKATITGDGKLSVLRGALGTIKENHDRYSLIRKVKPIPVEFRRPSIIRASGHTFEYLGYGPGNYSTGLPQVQLKTNTEREDFLAQSQESSCGSVVYTGMNNDGDFFIGNTKYSATSGEQQTFDIPTPTVTGQDTSSLSVVYDEVTVKERLVVEGGNSGTVLTQFDGPVTLRNDVQINGVLTLGSQIKSAKPINIVNVEDSSSPITGALIIAGGLGIGKSASIGGNLYVTGITSSQNQTDSPIGNTNVGSLIVSGGAAIKKNLNVGGGVSFSKTLFVTGVTTFSSGLSFPDNTPLRLGNSDDIQIVHDGSNSYIKDVGTGSLIINTTKLEVKNVTNNGTGIIFNENSSVELYFNNGKRLETTDPGVTVSGELRVTGDVIAFSSSDQRLKDNIVPIPNALEKVISISGNTFDWKEGFGNNGADVGVIAQEILEVLPEAVTERDNGYLAVRYEKIVPLLIEAIKELKSEIDDLKNQSSK